MYDRILIPLDGSTFAEEIIPYAVGLARSAEARITLLQAVQHDSALASAEEYVSGLAKRLGAEGEVVRAQVDPASTVVTELERQSGTLLAMTTHGRGGLLETILGSVARTVVQDAQQPVLLYRPRGGVGTTDVDSKAEIATVVTPLDGSDFSERILPHAVEMARAIKATLTLVQVVSAGFATAPLAPPGDVLESTYVHRWAGRIKAEYGIEPEWDALHGHPADAICRYVSGRSDVMLAMTSHARPRLKETAFGSVTHECVRRAGVPILVWGAKT
jgi:nucleotide-binding universal stress UspA family protein